MKILHVIPHYLPSVKFGGSPQSTHQMIVEQVKQGHEVILLTTDVQGPSERSQVYQEKHRDGYTIVRVRNLSNTVAYFAKFHIAPGLLSYLWRELPSFEVVHLHEYRSLLNVAALALRWRTQAQYILQPHGTYENFGGRKIFKQVFDFCFRNLLDGGVDKVVAISQKEFSQLAPFFQPEQLSLLYHGISLTDTPVKAPAKLANFTKSLPKKFILSIGRLHQVKRLDFLLTAYAQTGLANQGIELVIAGNDEGELVGLQDLAEKLGVQKKVRFIGTVDHHQKKILYKKALVTSYVTDQEPLGRVPLEAAICGCWSVIARESGVAELTNHAHFADKVWGDDVGELAKVLRVLSTTHKKVTPKDRRRLQRLTWKKQVAALQAVYDQPVFRQTAMGLSKNSEHIEFILDT